MKRTKILHTSVIKNLPFPEKRFDREAAADLAREFVDATCLVGKELASLSVSTLLINTDNVASFRNSGIILHIVKSLETIPVNPTTMNFISMAIASLHILIESDVHQRLELLKCPNSIFELFRICRDLIVEPKLQYRCFQVIQLLFLLDNSIHYFSNAKIYGFLVTSELLTDPRCHGDVTRGASDMLYKLLLFDPSAVAVETIASVCLTQIKSRGFRDVATEHNIFHGVLYALSHRPQASLEVLSYCLFCIRTERINDPTHLLLLLRCTRQGISHDYHHCSAALEHSVFSCLLYSSNHCYWKMWLVPHLSKHYHVFNNSRSLHEMKAVSFERSEGSCKYDDAMASLLYPKLCEILDEVCETVIEILRHCPSYTAQYLSSGLLASILANPVYTSVEGRVYPLASAVHLTCSVMTIALRHQDADSERFIPLLMSTSGFTSLVSSGGVSSLLQLTQFLHAYGLVKAVVASVASLRLSDDVVQVISGVNVLYLHMDRSLLTDDIVIVVAEMAFQHRGSFLICLAFVCMYITTSLKNGDALIRSSSVLFLLVQALKLPTKAFEFKSLVLSCFCTLASSSNFVVELRNSDKDAIPVVINEMSKKSLRQRRRANEDTEGFVNLLALLRRDLAIMRLQALIRGVLARRQRLAVLLLDKRQRKIGKVLEKLIG